MKTAISMDDGLFREADEVARLMGLSRSRLFALAVGDFLQRQRQEQMLLRLNEVYANGMEPAEKRLLKRAKARVSRQLRKAGERDSAGPGLLAQFRACGRFGSR